MGMPHRNNAPCVLTRRPHNHNQPTRQHPRCDEPQLTIIPPAIGQAGVQAREYFARLRKIQPAMKQGRIPLGRIKANLYLL
jgi:hypothetical protein